MIGFTGRRAALAVGLTVLGATPVLVAATSGGAAAKREALSCGATVTASVTLTSDITGCTGYGLIAGHSGIVINLNGHKISGSSAVDIGVYDASFSSVVVENGTVGGFVEGVEIDGGSATISHLGVHGNTQNGVFTLAPATITSDTIYSNGNDGVLVASSSGDKSSITGNIVTANGSDGIVVDASGTGSTLSDNHVLSNTGDGISVSADGVTVTGNIANGNGAIGMAVGSVDQAPPLKATSNIADDNTGLGVSLGAGDTDGGGNKAAGNGTAHQCANIVCS